MLPDAGAELEPDEEPPLGWAFCDAPVVEEPPRRLFDVDEPVVVRDSEAPTLTPPERRCAIVRLSPRIAKEAGRWPRRMTVVLDGSDDTKCLRCPFRKTTRP